MFLLNSIGFEWANKILVSSAKIIGAEVFFIILGKSFMVRVKHGTNQNFENGWCGQDVSQHASLFAV